MTEETASAQDDRKDDLGVAGPCCKTIWPRIIWLKTICNFQTQNAYIWSENMGVVPTLDERLYMTPRITLDRYVYEDIYPAFKAATDEKEITAKLSRDFLNYLIQRDLVFAGDAPAAVADIGCGPCDTLIKYLSGVRFEPGFTVRATDYLAEYADAERGEALQTLRTAQASNVIKLAGFSVRSGDAFDGKLLDLLSAPHDGTRMRHTFSLVFASHMMYHAESVSQVQRLIADVADNLLDGSGICILFHLGNRSGTFQDFRARFGSQARASSNSDTGAVTIDDPPAQIGAACASLQLPLHQAQFDAALRFDSSGDDEWQAFKDPQAYDTLADSNAAAYEDLKRLYFIVQRAPLEFAADSSTTGLSVFIDEIRQVIDANHGALPLDEWVQVFSRADAPPILGQSITDGIATIVAQVTGKNPS